MLCRVVHDGHNYVASAPGRRPYAGVKRRPKKDHEIAFRELYRGTKMGDRQETADGYRYIPGMTEKEQKPFIVQALQDTFGEIEDWSQFVDREMERERMNYHARVKRFKRKAFWNNWNYFCTFTYADEKVTEEAFKHRLRRALSNFHTRRGWYYMGCFERAPETGRLHFHGLFYVPDGEMVGQIREEEGYSKKSHKRIVTRINSWFEKRYGRNDFMPITSDLVKRGPTLDYILKYIQKTGERIIYSRGIPSETVTEVCYDQCACEFFHFVKKWVLFDDWRNIKKVSPDVLEGEEAVEWLICFTGYDYEGYTYYSEPEAPPNDTPIHIGEALKSCISFS